ETHRPELKLSTFNAQHSMSNAGAMNRCLVFVLRVERSTLNVESFECRRNQMPRFSSSLTAPPSTPIRVGRRWSTRRRFGVENFLLTSGALFGKRNRVCETHCFCSIRKLFAKFTLCQISS